MISNQGREYQWGQFMNVEWHVFKKVTYFKYLRHLLIEDNDLKMKIITRIQKSNKCFFGLQKMLSHINKPEDIDVHDPDANYSTICLRNMGT